RLQGLPPPGGAGGGLVPDGLPRRAPARPGAPALAAAPVPPHPRVVGPSLPRRLRPGRPPAAHARPRRLVRRRPTDSSTRRHRPHGSRRHGSRHGSRPARCLARFRPVGAQGGRPEENTCYPTPTRHVPTVLAPDEVVGPTLSTRQAR